MTIRLFRIDPTQRTFSARVIGQRPHVAGVAVMLDQTAFYPSAGGQPNDLGTLSGAPVLDVIETDDGQILHVLASVPAEPLVQGIIDWARRFDHMQQHSGQHVLSAAFVRTAGIDTASVHITPGLDQGCTLDLARPVTQAQAERAEDDANQCIYDARACKIYEVSDTELAGISLRKVPKVSGLIRIVEFDAYDWSACGGTHVANAAQIGMIRVVAVEKKGEGSRLHFRCGSRALQHYRMVNALVARLASSFTIGLPELETQVARVRDDLKTSQKQLADANVQLLRHEASALLAQAVLRNGLRVVQLASPGRDAGTLRTLAKILVETPDVVVLAAGLTDRAALCFARAANLNTIDVRPLLQAVLACFNSPTAKGGGAPDLAQGTAPASELTQVDAALDAAVALLLLEMP